MTAAQRRKFWESAILAALTVVLVPLIARAWNSKVDRSEWELQVLRDSAEKADIKRIAIEILCSPTIKPGAQECKP